MAVTITPLYAGLLALWFVLLSLRVVARRRGASINLGDGGDGQMLRRIRAHANFAEYVPFGLALLLMLELAAAIPPWGLHALGALLLTGRLLHGVALSYMRHFMLGRVLGTVMTFSMLLIAGVLCLWRGMMAASLAG